MNGARVLAVAALSTAPSAPALADQKLAESKQAKRVAQWILAQ